MINLPVLTENEMFDFLIELGQNHLIANVASHTPQERTEFLQQLNTINQNYPGGLSEYAERAKKLLIDSKDEVNPYEGYTPHVPAGEVVDFYGNVADELESVGIQEISKVCFVLVAGGLGERLGYEGIKIGIPIELVTNTSFLGYYVSYILAFQNKYSPNNPLPFAIMTSDDTNELTLKLLQENQYFGMNEKQITLIKQEKIPAMINNNAHFAQLPGRLLLDTKPHGHGDIHTLLYMSGLAQKWTQENRQWLFIFQDTNPLSLRALPSVLGVSKLRGFELNSITVARKPGEACGAICLLKHSNGSELTIGVEYNQLTPLMKTIGGEPVDEQGYSKFPGNINGLLFSLPPYNTILQDTKGLIAEFINPKYADSARTTFKSSTRLECMMQDYPKLLKPTSRVGITQLDRRFCFTAVKNDVVSAAQKQQLNLALECAASCENDFYWINAEYLRLAGAQFEGECTEYEFEGIKQRIGAKVVLHPSFGVTLKEIKSRINNLKVTQQSTLVLQGESHLDNVSVDGILKLHGNGQFQNIKVDDKKYQTFKKTNQEYYVPPHLKIRGYYLE